MIEIFPGLYIGDQNALMYADAGGGKIAPGWFVISAAKEPWHREALGYKERGAPKDHPEYLIARRERRLILNLIDVDNPEFIREEIVTAAVEAIDVARVNGDKVLIHCNQGKSRSPMLALLWMRLGVTAPMIHAVMKLLTVDQAIEAMKLVYPAFEPSKGMEGYARAHWEER